MAQRAIAWQAIAIAATALAFLARGWQWSLAALVAGASIALGGWCSARLALGGGVSPATSALLRMVAGVLVKWALVLLALLLVVGVARWPALAALAGVVVALVAQALAMVGRLNTSS